MQHFAKRTPSPSQCQEHPGPDPGALPLLQGPRYIRAAEVPPGRGRNEENPWKIGQLDCPEAKAPFMLSGSDYVVHMSESDLTHLSTCCDLVVILQKRSVHWEKFLKEWHQARPYPTRQPWTKGSHHWAAGVLVPHPVVVTLFLWTPSHSAFCLSFKQVFYCGHECSAVPTSFKWAGCANECCLQTFPGWWADWAARSQPR